MRTVNDSNICQKHAVHLMYDLFYLNRNEVVDGNEMWQSMSAQLLLSMSEIADEHLNKPFLFEPFLHLFSIGGLKGLANQVEKVEPDSVFVRHINTLNSKNNVDAKLDHERMTCHIIKTCQTQYFGDLLAQYEQINKITQKLRRVDVLYDNTQLSKQLEYEIWVMIRKLILNFTLYKKFKLDDFNKLKSYQQFCEFIDHAIDKNLYFELTRYIRRDYIEVLDATYDSEAAAHHERIFTILVEA